MLMLVHGVCVAQLLHHLLPVIRAAVAPDAHRRRLEDDSGDLLAVLLVQDQRKGDAYLLLQ